MHYRIYGWWTLRFLSCYEEGYLVEDIKYICFIGDEVWEFIGDIQDDDVWSQEDFDVVMKVLYDRYTEEEE